MSFSRQLNFNSLRVPSEPPIRSKYYGTDGDGSSYDADDDRGGGNDIEEKTPLTSEDEQDVDAYGLYSISWPHWAAKPMNDEFLRLAPHALRSKSYGSLRMNDISHHHCTTAKLTKQKFISDSGTEKLHRDLMKPSVHHRRWHRRHQRLPKNLKSCIKETNTIAHRHEESLNHFTLVAQQSFQKHPQSASMKKIPASKPSSIHINPHYEAQSLFERQISYSNEPKRRHFSEIHVQNESIDIISKNRKERHEHQIGVGNLVSHPDTDIVSSAALLPNNEVNCSRALVSHSPSHHDQWCWRRNHHHSYSSFLTSIHDMDQPMKKYIGTEQPLQCHGVIAAIIFLFQAALIITSAIVEIPGAWRTSCKTTIDFGLSCWASMLLTDTLLSGIFAIALCALVIYTMTISYKLLIQSALITACQLSLLWGVLGVASVTQASSSTGFFLQSYVPSTMGFLICMACTGYSVAVWRHIPFSSANLHVALMAISSAPYKLVWAMALLFQILTLLWSVLWTIVFISVCRSYDRGRKLDVDFFALVSLLLISYFWTCQVILNIVQVIVAKIVMKWWECNLAVELSDATAIDGSCLCCSCPLPPIMKDSLKNATIYSFGSICIGSFLMGPIQLVRQIMGKSCLNYLQDDSALDGTSEAMCPCVAKDSTKPSTISCHPLAYVYVSVYGYPFVEACRKASALIQAEGWSSVILDDNLISNALFLTNLVIGGCTGCLELFLFVQQLMAYNADDPKQDNSAMSEINNLTMMTYFIGLVIGITLSSVMMAVVRSAVHTIILCYASRPALSSRRAQPELNEEMFQGYYDDLMKHRQLYTTDNT